MSRRNAIIAIPVSILIIAVLVLAGCSSTSQGTKAVQGGTSNVPGVVTSSLPDGTVGVNYSHTMQASGGTAPYKWSVSSGHLPDGLKLAADSGTISGTPAAAGGFSFTIQVIDSTDTAGVATLYMNIKPSPNPPSTTTQTQAQLTITTTQPPNGTIETDYTDTLKAFGGSGTYYWAVMDGSLPDGLKLDSDTGLISGTSSKAGEFSFTVGVTDGVNSAYQQLTITINGMSKVSAANLLGIWGSSPDSVFAVGSGGTILFYDGKAWTSMKSGTTNTLHAVWGSSGNDVYAVGNNGTVLHYDGSTWKAVDVTVNYDLYNIWGSSADDIFASGSQGSVLHFDGSSWNSESGTTTENFFGIYGLSSNNVLTVGNNQDIYGNTIGVIFQYNGKNWNTMTSNAKVSLLGVWGISDKDIFAVGMSGTILHFDGNKWSTMGSNQTVDIHCIWGISGNTVFAAGDNGVILYFNGSGWSQMDSRTTEDLHGIWGSAGDGFFAVGANGFILHYNIPVN